jgi:hypothetical protein
MAIELMEFEKQNHHWVCTCGKQGRLLIWNKSVKAGLRHIQEHERKLEWGFEFEMVAN